MQIILPNEPQLSIYLFVTVAEARLLVLSVIYAIVF